jgi:hypothetical protein
MLNKEKLDEYQTNGYLVIESFMSVDECKKLKEECKRIIDSNNFLEELNQISSFESKDENAEVIILIIKRCFKSQTFCSYFY